MVLVDSSIWIEHLKVKNSRLVQLLELDQVLTHPFIIGELACGSLKSRKLFLENMSLLPSVYPESDVSVLANIESRSLYASGIGWVDAHLLSAVIAKKLKLWTHDKRLKKLAASLGVDFINQH